jgi:hypothetical protein
MKFSLGCSLVYHVPAPMPFVFNVEVASFAGQTIRHDRLSLDPDLPVERWTMPETGNRYLRVMAQPGDLRLRYEADVTLEPLLEDPEAVTEVPAAKLPFQVMSHLYPSRYCQSDKPKAPLATWRRAIAGSTASATGFAIMSNIREGFRTR